MAITVIRLTAANCSQWKTIIFGVSRKLIFTARIRQFSWVKSLTASETLQDARSVSVCCVVTGTACTG